MPLTYGAINSMVTPYTPSRGASGVGIQVAQALEQQRSNRAREQYNTRVLDRQDLESDAKERQRLLSVYNAALKQPIPDYATAKAAAYELKQRFGMDASGSEDPDANAGTSAETTPETPTGVGDSKPTDGPAPWLKEEMERPEGQPRAYGAGTPGMNAVKEAAAPEPSPLVEPKLPTSPGMEALTKTPEAPAEAAGPGATQTPAEGASVHSNRLKRYVLRDKTGAVATEGTVGGTEAQQRMAESFKPIIEQAPDEYSRGVARGAQELAWRMARWAPPEEAWKAGMDYYYNELDRRSKEARGLGGRGGGAIGGGGVGRPMRSGASETGIGGAPDDSNKNVGDDLIGFVKDWQLKRAMPKLQDILNATERNASMRQQVLEHPETFASSAVLGQLKAQIAGVASDKDMERFYDESATETAQRTLQWLMGQSQITPEQALRIMNQVEAARSKLLKRRAQLAQEAGRAAENFVEIRSGAMTKKRAGWFARNLLDPDLNEPPPDDGAPGAEAAPAPRRGGMNTMGGARTGRTLPLLPE